MQNLQISAEDYYNFQETKTDLVTLMRLRIVGICWERVARVVESFPGVDYRAFEQWMDSS